MKQDIIKNQIFLGIPWKNTKKKYENIRIELNKKFPLSFVIIGRDDNQDAEDLLDEIKSKLRLSDYAIFDATYGNPNVSLEFGYAEGVGIKRKLYLCQHGRTHKEKKERPIISDLGGKKYSSYKTENKLKALLISFSKTHEYSLKFERFIKKQRSKNKLRLRSLSLKIIHTFDEKESLRKIEISQKILDDQPGYYTDSEILDNITLLKNNGLLGCVGGGPNPEYWIR
jgi:hypothetical protein